MIIRELRARKAKYGFDGGVIYLQVVISMGRFLTELSNRFPSDLYITEETGMGAKSLRVYTDDNGVAEFIRNYK